MEAHLVLSSSTSSIDGKRAELLKHVSSRSGISVSDVELFLGKLSENSRNRYSSRVPRAEGGTEVSVDLSGSKIMRIGKLEKKRESREKRRERKDKLTTSPRRTSLHPSPTVTS